MEALFQGTGDALTPAGREALVDELRRMEGVVRVARTRKLLEERG